MSELSITDDIVECERTYITSLVAAIEEHSNAGNRHVYINAIKELCGLVFEDGKDLLSVDEAASHEQEMVKHRMGNYLIGYVHAAGDLGASSIAQEAAIFVEGVAAGLNANGGEL